MLGELYGCESAGATQSTTTTTTTQERHALTADLDWGVELRAEALVGRHKVGGHTWPMIQRHLWFKDLADSNALAPTLDGVAQIAPGQPAVFNFKMPACYPYTDAVDYQVKWTGGAAASNTTASSTTATGKPAIALQRESLGRLSPGKHSPPASGDSSACFFQAGQGDCKGDPGKETRLNLVWPAMGNNTVSVTLLGDKHGRVFPERDTQLNVNVQQAQSGTSGGGAK